jgi:hypothetical protein
MGINQIQAKTSTAPDTINTPKTNSPQENQSLVSSSKKDIDLSDLHEAANAFETLKEENEPHKVIQELNQKEDSKRQKVDPKKLNFFEKFLHDNWAVRTVFALGNEIAESCYELAEHLLPAPIAKGLYGIFWSMAVVATGSRVTMNAKMAKKGDQFKAGAKMLMHDGVSAIGAPTVVAKVATKVQNMLYKPLPIPQTLKHIIKSIVSLYACKQTIHWLDPHAMELSGNILKHKNDRHKEINDALGAGHGHGHDKKKKPDMHTALAV